MDNLLSRIPEGFERYAFIDASGQPSLDIKRALNSHFIIVSIIAKYEQLSLLSSNLDVIADKHFTGGEIKSSSVGTDDNRRLRIINDLRNVPFNYGALIIDKRSIDRSSGLIYATSFFKFCHNILFNHLLSPFDQVFIRLDDFGSEHYMVSFKKYILSRQTQIRLFYNHDVDFISSQTNRIVQLADFIAGTFAKVFDEYLKTINEAMRQEFWDFLKERDRNLWTRGWPPKYIHVEISDDDAQDYNKVIEAKAINTVSRFIEKHGESEERFERAQVETLQYLLYSYSHRSKVKYVSTRELCENLHSSINITMNDQTFWRNVIEPIKDEPVLIISSQKEKGYKIPSSIEEIFRYVLQADRMITPHAVRINRMREIIKMITDSQVDILSNYPHMIALLDVYGENQLINL